MAQEIATEKEKQKIIPGYTNVRGWAFRQDKGSGYGPYFQNMLAWRMHKKMSTNVVITGEAGIGKSYLATDICRVVDRRFDIPQVVYTYSEYLEGILKLRMGRPQAFDEPSYAMGKRDWFKELNKALVQTIESKRFKVHPLFIPIINQSLLDKTIRSYLIQFQIIMTDRGKAIVYRILPSQFTDKIYRRFFCHLKYHLFDKHLCKRDSCLDCSKIMKKKPDGKFVCELFRARYERKKADVQEYRYKTAKDQATKKELSEISFGEMYSILLGEIDDLIDPLDDTISVGKIMQRTHYGRNKAYTLKKMLDGFRVEIEAKSVEN